MESDEKLKTGYSGATSMVASEASVIWSTFNGMVNANAFLIGLIGAGLKFFPQIRWGGSFDCRYYYLCRLVFDLKTSIRLFFILDFVGSKHRATRLGARDSNIGVRPPVWPRRRS